MNKTMKFLCILLLSVVMLPLNAFAQTTGGKLHRATKSVQRSNAGKEVSKVQGQTAAVRSFEGSLLYRTYEHHSSMIRRFSYGRAYNGERTKMVTCKGDAVHITDVEMHLHTIIVPQEDKVYLYSDVTKTGLTTDMAHAKEMFGTLDPNQPTAGMTKKSTLQIQKERAKYKDESLLVYKGTLTTGENTLTDVEMWYTDQYHVPSGYQYVFNGLAMGGIVKKGIYTQTGSIPVLGKMKSTVASELIALRPCKVEDSEMLPPADVVTQPMTKATQEAQLYKANQNELKKRNLMPEKMEAKDVDYSISSQWDFAQEWLDKDFRSEARQANAEATWAKVIDIFGDILNIASGNVAGNDSGNDVVFDGAIDDTEYEQVDEEAMSQTEENREILYGIYLRRYRRNEAAVKQNIHDYKSEKNLDIQKDVYSFVKNHVKKLQDEMFEVRKKSERIAKRKIEKSRWEDEGIRPPLSPVKVSNRHKK